MATRADLVDWLKEALITLGGKSQIAPICAQVWERHEKELRASGNLFFTWQYDIRWAATRLRKKGLMKSADESPKGIWELAGK